MLTVNLRRISVLWFVDCWLVRSDSNYDLNYDLILIQCYFITQSFALNNAKIQVNCFCVSLNRCARLVVESVIASEWVSCTRPRPNWKLRLSLERADPKLGSTVEWFHRNLSPFRMFGRILDAFEKTITGSRSQVACTTTAFLTARPWATLFDSR